MRKKILIPLIILLLSIIAYFTIIIAKEAITKNTAIKNGEKYILTKLDSNKPFYNEAFLISGDKKKCTNCDPVNNTKATTVDLFFISQSIEDKLNDQQKTLLTKRLLEKQYNGEKYDLWSYYRKEDKKEWNDVDDTTFVMRSLEKLNIKYNLNDIGFFYDKNDQDFKMFMKNELFTNQENFKSQPEINANIMNLLLETKQSHNFNIDDNYILNSQNDDGSFKYYFYPSKYYSTYMFLTALCRKNNLSNNLQQAKNKAINFLINAQNSDGTWGKTKNDYETAMSLIALKTCRADENIIKKAENILIQHQDKKTGAWNSREIFWTIKIDNETEWGSYTNDTITTSLAIQALK